MHNHIKDFNFDFPAYRMSRKSYDAFCERFDEIRKRGLSNLDAFDEASKTMPFYKDAESFISTRSYVRKKKRGK